MCVLRSYNLSDFKNHYLVSNIVSIVKGDVVHTYIVYTMTFTSLSILVHSLDLDKY